MRPDNPQKQVILTNALTRVKRASEFADSAFRTRRQEVLAENCVEGQQCFVAMADALRRHYAESDENTRSSSLAWEEEDEFKPIVLNFVAEPAQRIAIDHIDLSLNDMESSRYEDSITAGQLRAFSKATIGRLAWGALSLRKVLQSESTIKQKTDRPCSIRSSRIDQLSLHDLSIINCAACYQDRQFDYSFMGQLSAGGADTVHKIAMLIATEYCMRIDMAITVAAKILVDPLVGGDGDHCRSMLKRRQLPPEWAVQYGLD